MNPSTMALSLAVLASGAACGHSPTSGPSTVAVATPTAPAAAAPGTASRSGVRIDVPGLPADYVEALLYGGAPNGNPHLLEAWEGGAFKHCVTGGLDPAIVAEAASIISAETGIPQRAEGPCNVTWEVRAYEVPVGGGAYCAVQHPAGAGGGPIVGATIVLRAGFSPGYFDLAIAVHELGHAIGLGHSPRREDVMSTVVRGSDFSASERAVITAVYR